MKKKTTLYDKLLQNFKDLGHTVVEDSWTETIGYKKPTEEFWFDVVVEDNSKERLSLHYYFKNNLNKIDHVQLFKVEYKIVESAPVKVF